MRTNTLASPFSIGQPGLAAGAMVALPVTLFFPPGLAYFGTVLVMLGLLLSGQFHTRIRLAAQSPLFVPVVALLAVSVLAGVFLDRPAGDFWTGFLHYQTYWFLLIFLALGAGEWQQRAVTAFYLGAAIAATLFYLNYAGLLPKIGTLSSYALYSGNKSIELGIMLAIASGWVLYDAVTNRDKRWQLLLLYLYIAVPTLTMTRTRTGLLLFLLLAIFVLLMSLRTWQRRIATVLVLLVAAGLAVEALPKVRDRIMLSVQDLTNFAQDKPVSDDGVRLNMYRATIEVIREKPLTGHGIGTWFHEYPPKARAIGAPIHSTPHNDYLLYLSEIGVFGLAALLWIWVVQFRVAARIGGAMGARLAMLSIGLVVGAMFNAILRDAVFALPFMILLAIPLAGVGRNGPVPPEARS